MSGVRVDCDVEFDCDDCGVHVFAFGALRVPSPPLCAACAILRTVADPIEREQLRGRLAPFGQKK